MKPLLILLTYFLLIVNSSAQLNLNKGKVHPKKYYEELSAEFKHNKLTVEVEIKGKKSRFIIDTGAPLCITTKCQQENQFEILKEDSIIDANGVPHLTKIVNVDTVKIGKLIYTNIPALVIGWEGFAFDCHKANGLIGSNLLRFGALQIDWKKKKVIITDSYKKLELEKQDAEKLLINVVQSSPYLTVSVDAKITDRLLVDTGSDDFYTFTQKGLDYVQSKGYLKNAVVYESKGCGSVGLYGPDTVSSDKLVKIDSLTIGNKAHLHKFYAVTTNDDQSRVGVYFLKQGVTTIDFRKGLFFFDLYENEFKYEYFSFGFDIINNDNKMTIGSVWKDSEACKKGLRINDEIIDIEGLSLVEDSFCENYFKYKDYITSHNTITIHYKKPNSNEVKQLTLNRMKLD